MDLDHENKGKLLVFSTLLVVVIVLCKWGFDGQCFHDWNYFIKAFLGCMQYRLNYRWECIYHRIIIIYLFVWNSNLWWILERKCSHFSEKAAAAAARPYKRQLLCVRVGLWRLDQPWNVHADDFPYSIQLTLGRYCEYLTLWLLYKSSVFAIYSSKESAFMWICLSSQTNDGAEVFFSLIRPAPGNWESNAGE